MSTAEVRSSDATSDASVGKIDMKLEVVTVPVSDVDRAKRFYQSLGWRLDADLAPNENVRVVQFTPPHSGCSIHIGKGLTGASPGSAERMLLAVGDIDAARQDLIARGIEVSEVDEQQPPPGLGSTGRSYFAYASFKDPDGNAWLLQEITTRIPGREWED